MEILVDFFNIALYRPLLNLLVLFYHYLPGNDFGVAIITLTVFVRVIFYPLNLKAIKSQKLLQELQPKIQELQGKYKNDKEKLTKATLELYQKERVNPMSGCLPILIQFPLLVALFWVFQKGLQSEEMVNLYSFVPNPGQINPTFLGFLNLAQPYIILAVICGIAQFFQAKTMSPASQVKKSSKMDFSTMMQKQMLYFFPIFTVLILWRLPSAIALYWLVTSLFSIFQQYLIFKPQTKDVSEKK